MVHSCQSFLLVGWVGLLVASSAERCVWRGVTIVFFTLALLRCQWPPLPSLRLFLHSMKKVYIRPYDLGVHHSNNFSIRLGSRAVILNLMTLIAFTSNTHDLSGLSRICLEVNAPSGFGRQNIDIDDVHIDDSLSPSSQVYVAELKAYANHFLSRVRVSVFAHNLHQPTYSKSRI